VTVNPAVLGAFGMMSQLSQAARPGGRSIRWRRSANFSLTEAVPRFAETMGSVVLKETT
jgi:hypothetical protein